MMTQERIIPLCVIFCDDIRKENNGKEILIGVYGGGITVAQVPATIIISEWIRFKRSGDGVATIPLEFRVIDLSENKTFGYVTTQLSLRQSEPGFSRFGSIALPGLPMVINHAATLTLQMKHHSDEPWETLGSVEVTIAPSISPADALSNESGPLSAQPQPDAEETSSQP